MVPDWALPPVAIAIATRYIPAAPVIDEVRAALDVEKVCAEGVTITAFGAGLPKMA